MMSAHRLSDVRHSQLLGRSSFLPARRVPRITTMSLTASGFRFLEQFKERETTDARLLQVISC
jgi:hypothetical protein